MVLSPAEKQRRYRDRLKKKERLAPDLVAPSVRRSFASFMNQDDEAQFVMSFMRETLASVGLSCPDFTQDVDPEAEEFGQGPGNGALSRATRCVGALIDCAKHLAETINRFKLAEVDAALKELEQRRATNDDEQKQLLAEAIRLNRLKERLRRDERHSVKPVEVKGA